MADAVQQSAHLSRSIVLQQIDVLYRHQSWLTRLYAHWRARYYPLDTYLKWLPEEGTIADVGCGRGVLTCLLASLRPQVTFIGYEPDPQRIRVARDVARQLQNVSFRVAEWEAVDTGCFDAILLIDTLHHIPPTAHHALVHALAQRLAPTGVLLINETDPATPQRVRFWWNYFSDVLLYPKGARCFFRNPTEMRDLLQSAELTVQMHSLEPVFGFATILYTCTKRSP